MSEYDNALIQKMTRVEFEILKNSQWLNSYLHERETSKADDSIGVKRPQEGRAKVDEPAEMKAKLWWLISGHKLRWSLRLSVV